MSKDTNKDVRPAGGTAVWGVVTVVGLLLIMAGAIAPVFNMGSMFPAFRYVFAAGALMLLIGRLFTQYKGSVIRLKRLSRIEAWSAIFFCVAAFFLFYNDQGRDWLAFTLAGAAIQVYTSIMIPYVSRKAK